jgi:hypothetical protein
VGVLGFWITAEQDRRSRSILFGSWLSNQTRFGFGQPGKLRLVGVRLGRSDFVDVRDTKRKSIPSPVAQPGDQATHQHRKQGDPQDEQCGGRHRVLTGIFRRVSPT